MVTVLLAHESRLVRQALSKILANQIGISVVGDADTGPDALKKAEELAPDVMVVDPSLPGLNGMLQKNSEDRGDRDLSMVVFAPSENGQGQGEINYIAHDNNIGDLVDAIIRSAGDKAREAQVYSRAESLNKLTKRERQILKLVADGLSNKQISNEMEITERTVKYHISNILRKLDLYSRTEAAILFLKGDFQTVAGQPA